MNYRDNTRIEDRAMIPVYQLMREAERRKQAEAEREWIAKEWWGLAWLCAGFLAGVAWMVWG